MAQLNPEEIPSINIWDTSAIVLASEPEKLMKPEFRENYENLISFSGLKLHQEVSYRDVEIERGVFVHEIYTISPKSKNLPHLLYIHGYGGTALNSYRLLKHLHKHYQVHAIDRLGEGFSSLSNFSESFTYDENRAYFLSGIEGWRKKMKIQSFVLVAHSYGGYIASCYANQHSNRVKRLILLSPAGFTKQFELDKNKKGDSWMTKLLKSARCAAQKVYNMNITPKGSYESCIFGKWTASSMVPSKSSKTEEEAWKIFIRNYLLRESHSEMGFYLFFDFPIAPKKDPIVDLLSANHIKFSISIVYGESDWMNMEAAEQFCKSKANSSFHIVKKAGHKLIFQDPEEVCNIILQMEKKL